MRLWSIHPKYLDTKGLVALWREALLAQAVLRDETKGYKNHPQLLRFKNHSNPTDAISAYLTNVFHEAASRGHTFNASKIRGPQTAVEIQVTHKQIAYEYEWLCTKLKTRCPEWLSKLETIEQPEPHPLFKVVDGDIEPWEKI